MARFAAASRLGRTISCAHASPPRFARTARGRPWRPLVFPRKPARTGGETIPLRTGWETRRATSQEEKRAIGEKDPEDEEEEADEGEDEETERRDGISAREKENKMVQTHRNPNRVMSTSLFLDGSREPSSTGLKHEHRTDRPVTKYRAEPGTERTDGVCRPSHPGRALNGLRVEGRKEGGGGRRAEPRQR